MGTSNVPATIPQPSAGVAVAQGETAASAVAARAKADIEARAIVAMNRPRNVERFRLALLEACRRSRFAAGAWYSKPVGGKPIEGLSIRFAEECARHYGNLAIDAQVIYDDGEKRIIRVTATDLETNNAYSLEVTVNKTVERRSPKQGDEVIRSRTNSNNQTVYLIRADEDALLNKQAALISKARRQLILQHIPSDIAEEASELILETRKSEVDKDPVAARKRMVDAFFQIGVGPEDIEEFLGKPLANITKAEIHFLHSVYTGMKEEGTSWAEVLELKRGKKGEAKEEGAQPKPNATSTEKLAARLGAKKAEAGEQVIPPIIKGLLAKEKAGQPLSDEASEELRQWKLDNPWYTEGAQ